MSKEIQRLASEEALPGEDASTATIRCESPYCDREVYEAATVDVVVGATVGEWSDPRPHVGVTGTDSASPVVEQWCLTCAEQEFGIETSAHEKRVEQVSQYVTMRTVSAFLTGIVIALLVSSVLLV